MDRQQHVIAGVDTHADTHYAAVAAATGQHLGAAEFPATTAGYAGLRQFICCFGPLMRVGVEGTNSYGAGLSRHLAAAGIDVVEVIRPGRQVRRMRGKCDEVDAYAAAHTALADNDTVTAKTGTGVVEAIRVTLAARNSAVDSHRRTITQIKSLLITAPDAIRTEHRRMTTITLIRRLAKARGRGTDGQVAARTRTALKRLAVRCQQLDAEIASHDTDLIELVHAANPALMQVKGIGAITGAQLLVTAGDNSDRITTEASFAMLCGAAPIPASSGKTSRYRLNRGGDRAANAALHQIAINRLASDPETQAYAARRTGDDKTKKDILRCLKRAIAREAFHLITKPRPAETNTDLRPTRRHLKLTLIDAAAGLDCSVPTIARAEKGPVRDSDFVQHYRTWLAAQKPVQIAT